MIGNVVILGCNVLVPDVCLTALGWVLLLHRILFSKSASYSVSKFQLLGTEKMAEGVFPSDHFGVQCVLRVKCRKEASESSVLKRHAAEEADGDASDL